MKTPREILLDRHRSAIPALDRLRRDVLQTELGPARPGRQPGGRPAPARAPLVVRLWEELFWAGRWAWSGLAVCWLLIIGANWATREPAAPAGVAGLPAVLAWQVWQAEPGLLADRVEPDSEPPSARPPGTPGPRSAVRRFPVSGMA